MVWRPGCSNTMSGVVTDQRADLLAQPAPLALVLRLVVLPELVALGPRPYGSAVKLNVIHDGFEPGSEMLEACSGRKPESGGWPELFADRKSLLDRRHDALLSYGAHRIRRPPSRSSWCWRPPAPSRCTRGGRRNATARCRNGATL
jgi:hypothetical protein